MQKIPGVWGMDSAVSQPYMVISIAIFTLWTTIVVIARTALLHIAFASSFAMIFAFHLWLVIMLFAHFNISFCIATVATSTILIIFLLFVLIKSCYTILTDNIAIHAVFSLAFIAIEVEFVWFNTILIQCHHLKHTLCT